MNAKDLARQLTESRNLTEAGETLGIVLAAAQRAQLLTMVNKENTRGLTLETLLSFLERVAHGESDLVVDRLGVVGLANTWVQFLGVRWEEGGRRKLTIGARTHWASSRIDSAWPELAPWSRTLVSNRNRAEAWARVDARDRMTFELSARPTTSRELDEVALRAAIADAPDDVAPRLVFADWLLEQGNPLGELIHLSLSAKPDLQRLRALDESWQRWAGPLEPYTQRHWMKAGFVTEVSMTVPAFEKHGAAFFRAHPVLALWVDLPATPGKHLERLSKVPALDLVRALKLDGSNAALDLVGLAKGSRFARLEELHVHQAENGPEDWRDLLLGLRAPKLSRVSFRNNLTSCSTLRWLAQNPVIEGLVDIEETPARCLEPKRGESWEQTFAALAERHPGLQRLDLQRHATIDDDGLAPLFASTSKVSLRELWVEGTAIGTKLLRTITSSPRSSQLTQLAISVNDSAMVDPLGDLLSESRVPIQSLTLTCDHRQTAERLNAMLQTLPATTSLKRVDARGTMYIPVRRGVARFDVLGF